MTRRAGALLAVAVILAGACGDDGTVDGEGDAVPPDVPSVHAASDGAERVEPDPDAPVEALAAGLNDAGFHLLRTLPIDDKAVFSPSSIGHALLMARAAADEPTGAAIDAAFALPDGIAAHDAWNAIDRQLAALGDVEDGPLVRLADRIWPQLGLTPEQSWVDLLATHHGSDVQPLDLQGDSDESRRIINGWVAEQTEGLIPELLPDGFITPLTVLVLTDAMYLEAPWRVPFDPTQVQEGSFASLDGTQVDVELMRHVELVDAAAEGDGFVAVDLPYVGGDLAMLVILPDDGRFVEVRDRLDQALLDEIDANVVNEPTELLLPRWSTHTEIDLLRWLSELGAAPGAYPAISPGASLAGAVHGADIAVDEVGTVAAAATALGFDESAPAPPDSTVRVDRPFFYLIRHRPSGLVLFAGQVTDPTT